MTTFSSIDVPNAAKAVAAHLGNPWQAAAGAFGLDSAELIGPGYQRVCLSLYRQRWNARGVFPNHRYGIPYGIERPEISVAVDRGVRALATEITRRLLPPYTVLLDRVLEHQAEGERKERARELVATRIEQVLPDARRLDWDDARLVWYPPGPGIRSADIKISPDAMKITKLELGDLPVEAALQVLELVAEQICPPSGEQPASG